MIDVRITRFEHRNQISGIFQFNGHWYLADLIEISCGFDLYDTPYEFMVFKSDEQGKVTDWSGEFVLRPILYLRKFFCSVLKNFVLI